MPTDPPPPLSDPRDYILELSTAPSPSPANTPTVPGPTPSSFNVQRSTLAPKPHLSIHFKCCNIYAPIYKDAAGTAYAGHCPRCAKPLRIPIAPGGTSARIFEAG